MKLVYVASRWAPTEGRTQSENEAFAIRACNFVARKLGACPVAPHLFFRDFLSEPEDRELGIGMGMELLDACDELLLFVDHGISYGMFAERLRCVEMGKLVRYCHLETEELT